MKKIISIVMLLAIVVTMMAGCGVKPSANQSSGNGGNDGFGGSKTTSAPAASAAHSSSSGGSSSGGSSGSPKNASDGYTKYEDVKGTSYDRISDKIGENPELALTAGMSIVAVSMVDINLIFISVLTGTDPNSAKMALAVLGIKDADVKVSGDTYTLAYTDADGKKVKQTCKYNAAKDQMTSSTFDESGKETMFFEYTDLGNDTYASQYYSVTDGKGSIVLCYFNKTNISAYGMGDAKEKPASILNTSKFSEDFVKTASSYYILKDDKITVSDNGTVKTY